MATPVFPTLALARGGFDAQSYSVELEDPSMKSNMEGGYVVSRALHTRTPRKTFGLTYTGITEADRATLEAFYSQVHGGAVIFSWTDPINATSYMVRFADKLNFVYAGVGVTRLWNLNFQIQQA